MFFKNLFINVYRGEYSLILSQNCLTNSLSHLVRQQYLINDKLLLQRVSLVSLPSQWYLNMV